MGKELSGFLKRFAQLYSRVKVPRAAAALSYFLTMTIFPLLICLYTMLGNSYDKAIRLLRLVESFFAPETLEVIKNFLNYVAENNSTAMMIAGLTVLITSASAASRTIHTTIGEMQGGQRYIGLANFVFSIIFSLVFLAVMYFAAVVMLSGRQVMSELNRLLPFIDISNSWHYLRFPALGGISFVILWGVYGFAKRKNDRYKSYPGAIAATFALVAISLFFSYFINVSAKYPLVYGSLAAVILLMFWLYTCSIAIFCGAIFNVILRDAQRGENKG